MECFKEILRFEIDVKHFGFSNCRPEHFYVSQWCKSRLAFLIYRILLFLYTFAWILADVSMTNQPDYWVYPSSWSEVTECLYFFVSMMVTMYGYYSEDQHQSHQDLKWFHKIVWVLFSTAISVALAIDLAFWLLLSGKLSSDALQSPFNIHSHLINYVLLLLDLSVNSIPKRILHFIYPIGYGLVYTIFITVVWASGHSLANYQNLNLQVDPSLAAMMTMLASFVLLPLLHIFWHFWLCQLRSCLAEIHLESKQEQLSDDEEKKKEVKEGETNIAFE